MTKVSIIIPCYNQADYIEPCLQSIRNQTLQDWECIVVDDGSTDDSASIVNRIMQQDPRIRLICKENGGTASARNAGLQIAQGEYIQFIDADDWFNADKLQIQTEWMDNHISDISYTSYQDAYLREEKNWQYVSPHMHSLVIRRNFVLTMLTRWGIDFSIPHMCLLFRTSFLKKQQLSYNEQIRVREDWNMLIDCAYRKAIIKPLLFYNGVFYRHSHKSKTSSYLKMTWGNILFICQYCHQIPARHRIWWAYRLSAELWRLIGRIIKYREFKGLSCLAPLKGHIFLTIFALLWMPISLFQILLQAIRTYWL